MYLIVLVGPKPILSTVKEAVPSHLMRLHLVWIVEVLSMCPVALVSRRPDLHVLLSHHAQSPQLSSFAPSWCCYILYHLASALWVFSAQSLIIPSAAYVAVSVSVVFASCFWPQTVDVENSLYFTKTCGWWAWLWPWWQYCHCLQEMILRF